MFTIGGGGTLGKGGTLIVKGVTLQNGYDSDIADYGGAVALNGGSATFSSCSFVNNTAVGGGAVFVTAFGGVGSVTFLSCSFVKNTATSLRGGAVLVASGSAAFSSCSFVKNTVASYELGGAVYVLGGSVDSLVRIVNCSFEADGSGKKSKANGINIFAGKLAFGCPTGTTGADVPIKPGSDLGTSQLPPAKQIVSCH
jgi:hypothetical protein